MLRIKLLILVFLGVVTLKAQELRPVTSAWTIGVGTGHLADTYLSPLHYDGQAYAIGYERFQAMRFSPERWIMRLDAGVNTAFTHNPARNADMTDLNLHFSWAMLRRFSLAGLPVPGSLTVAPGGAVSLEGGALYLSRNGNNPISAKGAVTLDFTVPVIWSHKIGRLPFTLRYQPSLPIIGAFFSPDYGELYYEIYLGNKSGLAHCAWFGNRFAMDNLLTLDLRFGATALRLGYDGGIMCSHVNNITTRRFTHLFVIGISSESITLSPNSGISESARIISAFY